MIDPKEKIIDLAYDLAEAVDAQRKYGEMVAQCETLCDLNTMLNHNGRVAMAIDMLVDFCNATARISARDLMAMKIAEARQRVTAKR